MNLLWILAGIFTVYAAESFVSCLRLGAFVRNSRLFYLWDNALVILSFCAIASFLCVPGCSGKLLIVLAAVAGNQAGAMFSRQIRNR